MMKKVAVLVICSGLGLIFLVAGCVLTKVFADFIHSKVEDGIPLKQGSDSYNMWQSPTSPIFFQVWMFDLVNPEEVMKGEKPALIQMGPYTYSEKREKFNITFNKNGTVNYREKRTYIFRPDMSVGTENDTFTTINLLMLTIAELTQYESMAFKDLLSAFLILVGERLFMKLSVHDLMWGYEDPLLKAVNSFIKDLKLNLTIPDIFGLFYNHNGTDDGLYEIYSGQAGVDNFGEIVSWNGLSALKYWTDKLANKINGSDGTIYPPFVDTKDTKYLFSSDLCRSLAITYSKSVSVRGIDLDKFVAPDIVFGNVSINPYNKGFCTPAGNCLPSGLLNVSTCRSGAPVVMSMPHFLGCDEATQKAVIGLSPNREEHESYIDIEPMTGVAMNVGKRLQINVFLQNIKGYTDTENVTPVFFPVMWLNESAMISSKDAAKFKSEVLDKITVTEAVQYGLIAVGLLIILCILAIVIIRKFACKKEIKFTKIVDEPILHSATT